MPDCMEKFLQQFDVLANNCPLALPHSIPTEEMIGMAIFPSMAKDATLNSKEVITEEDIAARKKTIALYSYGLKFL